MNEEDFAYVLLGDDDPDDEDFRPRNNNKKQPIDLNDIDDFESPNKHEEAVVIIDDDDDDDELLPRNYSSKRLRNIDDFRKVSNDKHAGKSIARDSSKKSSAITNSSWRTKPSQISVNVDDYDDDDLFHSQMNKSAGSYTSGRTSNFMNNSKSKNSTTSSGKISSTTTSTSSQQQIPDTRPIIIFVGPTSTTASAAQPKSSPPNTSSTNQISKHSVTYSKTNQNGKRSLSDKSNDPPGKRQKTIGDYAHQFVFRDKASIRPANITSIHTVSSHPREKYHYPFTKNSSTHNNHATSTSTSSLAKKLNLELDQSKGLDLPKKAKTFSLEDREERKRLRERREREMLKEKERQKQPVVKTVKVIQNNLLPVVEDRIEINKLKKMEEDRKAELNRRKCRVLKFMLSVTPADKESDIPELCGDIPHIPVEFGSEDAYGEMFEQHIYLDVFAQIQRGVIEEEFPSESLTVIGHHVIDKDFVDVYLKFKPDISSPRSAERLKYNQYDYIRFTLANATELYGFSSPFTPDKAKELGVNRLDVLCARFLRSKLGVDFTRIFYNGCNLTAQKVTSLGSVTKAFYAIHSVNKLSPVIRQTLLHPTNYPITNYDDDDLLGTASITELFKKFLVRTYNESQINAILTINRRKEGITLIQGPPGTGKTSTIVGAISTILRDRRKEHRKKVLFCAPSNAAVDELTQRIYRNGLIDSSGQSYKPRVIRVGVKSRVSEEVVHLFIDNQVRDAIDQRVSELKSALEDKTKGLKADLETVRSEITSKRAKVKYQEKVFSADSFEVKRQLTGLEEKEKRILLAIQQYERDCQQQTKSISHQHVEFRKLVLASADVICATLGSVGHQELTSITHIIIDESCQCVEPDALVPLVYNSSCKSITLVGDPQQLPATVLSKASSNKNYTQSMMERLLSAGCAKIMLQTQYRMHSAIASFPNRAFYEGQLHNGPKCDSAGQWLLKHNTPTDFRIEPYQVYDVTYSREVLDHRTKSLKNEGEAEFVANLYVKIMNSASDPQRLLGSVGIISPYRQQIYEIKRRISNLCGPNALKYVQVATVDAFQGKEKDVIIFSCVRAQSDDNSVGIGFLNDVRRMNVGITRAKYALYIVCNAKQLSKNQIWRELISDAKTRNQCTQITKKQIPVQPLAIWNSYAPVTIKPVSSNEDSKHNNDVTEKTVKKSTKTKTSTTSTPLKLTDSFLEQATPPSKTKQEEEKRPASIPPTSATAVAASSEPVIRQKRRARKPTEVTPTSARTGEIQQQFDMNYAMKYMRSNK